MIMYLTNAWLLNLGQEKLSLKEIGVWERGQRGPRGRRGGGTRGRVEQANININIFTLR